MTDNVDARTPYADQRKNHILDRLLSNGRVDAMEVAESLGVTGETIRKDLIALERQGLAKDAVAAAEWVLATMPSLPA